LHAGNAALSQVPMSEVVFLERLLSRALRRLYAHYILREAIREEVTAVLRALSDLKLINIPRQNVDLVTDVITYYACKSSGVRNHVN